MGTIIDFFTNSPLSELASGVKSILKTVVVDLYQFIYDLIFVDIIGTSTTFGRKIINFLCNKFLYQPFSLHSLAFLAGFAFTIFLIKQAIHIIRG